MENDLRGFINLIQKHEYGYVNYDKPNKVTKFLMILLGKMIKDGIINIAEYYFYGNGYDELHTNFEHISLGKIIFMQNGFSFTTKDLKEVKISMKNIFIAVCDDEYSTGIKFMDDKFNEVIFWFSNADTPDDNLINSVLKEMHIVNL